MAQRYIDYDVVRTPTGARRMRIREMIPHNSRMSSRRTSTDCSCNSPGSEYHQTCSRNERQASCSCRHQQASCFHKYPQPDSWSYETTYTHESCPPPYALRGPTSFAPVPHHMPNEPVPRSYLSSAHPPEVRHQSGKLIQRAADDLQELSRRLRDYTKIVDILRVAKLCPTRQEITDRHESVKKALIKDVGQPLLSMSQRDISYEHPNDREAWVDIKDLADAIGLRLNAQLERLNDNHRKMIQEFCEKEDRDMPARQTKVTFTEPEMFEIPAHHHPAPSRSGQHHCSSQGQRPQSAPLDSTTDVVDMEEIRRMMRDMQVKVSEAEAHARGLYMASEAREGQQPPGYDEAMRE